MRGMPTGTAPLSMAQLPSSVFAEHAWQGVSDKYAFIPTYQVVSALDAEGFHPYIAKQSFSRIEGKRGYTKHLIRFRSSVHVTKPIVGNVWPEIVLVNSHDRASSFSLELGLFRVVCANGLVVSHGTVGIERVRHIGYNSLYHVSVAARNIVSRFPQIADTVQRMQQTVLSDSMREQMASTAMGLRWDADKAPFAPQHLLQTRRVEDRGKDLWTTYNVIQENLLRGQSMHYRGRFYHHGEARNPRSSREVKAIDTEMALNRGLWDLAAAHLPYHA